MEITFPWIFYGLVFVPILFILTAYLYMTRNFKYWKKRSVMEIAPKPFVGNFGKYFTNQKSPGALFKNLYDKSEGLPYLGIYILDKPCLLIRDPEILKRILIKDFNYFSDKLMHSSVHDVMSNNSIFFIDNPYWKYIRQKFTAVFTSGKLKMMFENVQGVGEDLQEYLNSLQLEGAGKEINMKDIAAKFTTDLVGMAIFGLKLNSLKDPNAEFRKFGKALFGTYNFKRAVELTTLWLAPHFASFFDCRFFLNSATVFFRKAFNDILNERSACNIKRNDFIDLMLQLRDNVDEISESHGYKFEGDNLIGQALMFFAAGYDTSSAAMSYSLFEIAKNNEIQSRLREEINSAIEKNNGKITYEMITELQYMDMVLSETLRKYPTLPFLDRKTTRDYKIEQTGLVIEKGTPIIIPMLGFHHDPKYFPDPHIFNPERFSTVNKSSRNPYVYFPFGIGPRNCIGMRQGLLQTKLGLVYLLSKFEVSAVNKNCIEFDKLSILSSAKGGLFLNVRKINK